MKCNFKIALLIMASVIMGIGISLMKPIPQDTHFHNFADGRTFLGVQNFMDVASNVFFIIIGGIGLYFIRTSNVHNHLRAIYTVLFAGIILVGLGSAYYHYSPSNNSLVYDRIPMTIVFMAFLSATIAECINAKSGYILLFPLVIMGISSVLWWYYTEQIGAGDLRFYGFVQFYPMVMIPLILLFFSSSVKKGDILLLLMVVIWYGIAKFFEHYDDRIYTVTGFISGHSLKHIAAAVATWYIVRMFARKYVSL